MRPFVSILIPCFNAEQWLKRAIESALAQTWPEKEVIVIDDGSTDRSLEIIRSFGDSVKWETGPNRGGGATRNRLLEIARGEWIQYLDADDYLLPEKVAHQLSCLERHPNCDVIYSPLLWQRVERGLEICAESPIPGPRDSWVLLARWLLPQTGAVLWRRAALVACGGWRVGQPCCQEHELYCRLLESKCTFQYCEGAFAVYCDLEHEGRVTRRAGDEFVRQRLKILQRIERHLAASSQLSSDRLQALNDARHELARRLWNSDRGWALATFDEIAKSDRSYVPTVTAASPPSYLFAFRVFGFKNTQHIASFVRSFRSQS